MTQPGWYTDPVDPTTSRFWTGTAWTAGRHWNGSQWIDAPLGPAPVVPYEAAYAAPYPAPDATPAMGMGAPARPTDRRGANRAYLAIAGAALVVIGCLMPWATQDYGFTTVSIKGTSAGGGQLDLVLALAVITLTVLFLAGRTGWKSSALSLTLSVLIIVICIANMANISHVIDQEKTSGTASLLGSSGGTNFGLGIILVLIGGCIAGVGVLLSILSQRKSRRA